MGVIRASRTSQAGVLDQEEDRNDDELPPTQIKYDGCHPLGTAAQPRLQRLKSPL
jgi:hypothetical protein